MTRLEDAVAIAAYCQAVVKALCERYDAGEEIPTYHRILTSENKWLAARYGLDAPIMDLATGSTEPHPDREARPADAARARAARARARAPSASSRGSRRSSARGNSAERQLRIFNANRDIVEVARAIADATEGRGAS